MVFYVDDEKEQGWSIPVHLRPRDLYDMVSDIPLCASKNVKDSDEVNDAEKQVVTANPDINTVDHAEDEFMVIACDGIWLIFFQVLGFYIKKGTVDGNFDEIFHFEVLVKLEDYVESMGSIVLVFLVPSIRALYLPMAYVRVSHKTSKQVQGEVPSSKKDN
ncbi:putative protein phosphatase 2C [Trifolium repens]|nr:putative protein phosphatase 2C [Trifolium repens]